MAQKPTLLILAAGMGSRYGGLKQLDEIGPSGEIILDYSVYDAAKAGFGKVVFVIRKSIETAFKNIIDNRYHGHIEIDYAIQEVNVDIPGVSTNPNRVKPWGTAHAVLVAEDKINEPFAVINADDYYGGEAFKRLKDYFDNNQENFDYAMVGYVLGNTLSENGTVSRGICQVNADSLLEGVVERHQIEQVDGTVYFEVDQKKQTVATESIVSMNFWAFKPSVFKVIRTMFIDFLKENGNEEKSEFYIPLVVNHMIKTNQCKLTVLKSNDKWYGITYKADKAVVAKAFEEMAKNNRYPTPLWSYSK